MKHDEKFIGDFPKKCEVCDDPLPEGRQDDKCADCRAWSVAYKRCMRPKVETTPTPAQFAQR